MDLLKSQIAEICPRIWILASYRYGIMKVGEVKEDDIIYARKIKAVADKWLPPLYAWRQHEETLSFPSLIRKITNELAPTFMIDHVAAAILVDIADSFFATVVRTTMAISESRSYIRFEHVLVAIYMCFGETGLSTHGLIEIKKYLNDYASNENDDPLSIPLASNEHKKCLQLFSEISFACESNAREWMEA